MSTAAVKGQNITIQDAQTVGNGTALAIPPGVKKHTFYIRGNGAIGAGAITLETASDPDYTGTWALLVNDLATPTANPVTVVGNAEVIYRIDGTFTALRARISTTITTTTVTVIYRGSR